MIKNRLNKLKHVSAKKLIIIVFYKILYKISFYIEKARLRILRHRSVDLHLYDNRINYKKNHYLFEFNQHDQIIVDANLIMDNQIKIFDSYYKVKATEWLKDPLSENFWSAKEDFNNVTIEKEGYGDVKFIMELNKFNFLVTLAQAYYITKEEKFINKIAEYIQGWVDNVPVGKSIAYRSIMDIAFRSLNLIYILNYCQNNNLFEKIVRDNIYSILILSERQMRKFATPRWCKFSTGANHTIGEMVGLLVTQIWLKDMVKGYNYEKYYKRQLNYLNRCLNNIITEEGVYLEHSANYARLVSEFLIILDIFSDDVLKDYNNQYLKKLLSYILQISNSNDVIPNFGDNDAATALQPLYEGYNRINHIRQYSNKLGILPTKDLKCYKSGHIAWNTPSVNLFIRSGSHSFLPIGCGSHSHNDLLSILLSVNGHEVFIDKGCYLYNSGIEILTEDRSTSEHNTVNFKDIEQADISGKWIYSSYPTCEINEINFNDNAFKFYGYCQYGGFTHHRKIDGKENKIEIVDTIVSSKSSAFEINFLLAEGINILKDDAQVCTLIKDGKPLLIMNFSNINDISVLESTYHPMYGKKRFTNQLVLKGSVHDELIVSTKIEILPN